MALWFPYLTTERIRRARLGPAWRLRAPPEGTHAPLVVSHRENNAQRITALDAVGARLGLRRGMGIADARAMHPGIEVIEAEPQADRRLMEAVADWCDRYTPLVALEGDDGLFLDISGCAHLFGGESEMLRDALARLAHHGFAARGGLASTPGAAWAAARYLDPSPVPPGAEAAALGKLPVAALRLDADLRAALEGVGLRTVEAVMANPRAPLARRFGKALMLRLDQALARVEEAVSPRLPVAALSVERHLAEPISLTEDLERLILMLAKTMKSDLERRGEGALTFELALFRVDGAVPRLKIAASRPLRDPAAIHRLFRERLAAIGDEVDAGFGFELVRLCAIETASLEPAQTDLSGGRADQADDLAHFADRVRARLGEAALSAPHPVESHIPERAAPLAPFTGNETGKTAQTVPARVEEGLWRPLRLLSRPEPIEVAAAEVPEGPPLRFRWRRTLCRVARAEGPERIAPEWWHGQNEETRDYFRVEDEEGRRYWLYRQGFYDASAAMPRWFLHGLLA